MIKRTYALLLLIVAVCTIGQAQAAEVERRYNILEGHLQIQPGFCIPSECASREARFYGSLTAVIDGDRIAFKDIQLKSEYAGFTLPDDPYDLSNGSVADVKFSLDGEILRVNGYVDSRAFDGPLVEYRFVAEALEEAPDAFDAEDYFHARRDFRRCVAPECGGIFVRKLNNLRMSCPDGTVARECYIGQLDMGDLTVDAFAKGKPGFNTDVILKGQVSVGVDPEDSLGVFSVEEVWRSATGRRAVGRYYGIVNNEIVCITSPCYSYDQYTLNLKEMRPISDVDLSEVGASDQDLTEAYRRMGEGEPLLATGLNRRVKHATGDGIRFAATQFYLPVKSRVVVCEAGYTEVNGECVTSNGCAYPSIELETVSGAPDVDPVSGELGASYTYTCEERCDPPADLVAPARCHLALPQAAP